MSYFAECRFDCMGFGFMRPLALRLSIILFALICGGCHRTDELNSSTAKRLRILAAIYGDYAAATGKGPLDTSQLLAHAINLEPFVTEALTLGDEIIGNFHSDRDGEPFVIRFGVPASELSGGSRTIIAYERFGSDGRRLVTNLNGVVECLDDHIFSERNSR